MIRLSNKRCLILPVELQNWCSMLSLKRTLLTSKDADTDVRFDQVKTTGVIELNRPSVLNSLNLPMIRKLYPMLRRWEEKNSFVRQVMIFGVGEKAFCAGGDVVEVVKSAQDNTDFYKDFFREEYYLNHKIATYKKPFVAIIDGITMGGGVGLSIHGAYRVATERTVMAMPETSIGLFPDVGSALPLSRLSNYLGEYLTLTGYRLKGQDLHHANIATHFVQSHMIPQLIDDIEEICTSKHNLENLREILKKYHDETTESSTSQFSLASNLDRISNTFCHETVEDIMSALEKDGSDWAQQTLTLLKTMSPISMKITLRLMKEAAKIEKLEDLLKLDYRLARRCVEDGDFIEGVRSKLIDKDNKPTWKASSVQEVSNDLVDHFFSPLPEDEEWSLPPEAKPAYEHGDL